MSRSDSDLLYYLAGERFPGADEDKLARLSRALNSASVSVSESVELLAAAVRKTRGGVGGRSQDAFLASMDGYVRSPGYLTTSSTHLGNASKSMSDSAMQVQYQKMQIYGAVTEVFGE